MGLHIKKIESPGILHIATHGFFLPDQDKHDQTRLAKALSNTENPLLRCGLAFAGAQAWQTGKSRPESDNGILTAWDIRGMNLRGTQLVTLSACETALGEFRRGRGVL